MKYTARAVCSTCTFPFRDEASSTPPPGLLSCPHDGGILHAIRASSRFIHPQVDAPFPQTFPGPRAARIHFVDNVNGEPILHDLAVLRVVAPTRDAAAAAAAALIRRLAEVMAATARRTPGVAAWGFSTPGREYMLLCMLESSKGRAGLSHTAFL